MKFFIKVQIGETDGALGWQYGELIGNKDIDDAQMLVAFKKAKEAAEELAALLKEHPTKT